MRRRASCEDSVIFSVSRPPLSATDIVRWYRPPRKSREHREPTHQLLFFFFFHQHSPSSTSAAAVPPRHLIRMLQPALLCLASVASQCPTLSLAVPARDAANTLQVSLSGWSVPQVRCHSSARPTCCPNRRTGTLGRLRWSGEPPRTARRRSTPSNGSPSRPTRVPPPGRPSHPLPAALCA